jgi:hypothetical protein
MRKPRSPLLLQGPCAKIDSPVRPLLVQHAMTTVPATNGLAALQRDILIAVAAFVVDGARVGVDGDARRVLGAGLGVLLRGHDGVCVRG